MSVKCLICTESIASKEAISVRDKFGDSSVADVLAKFANMEVVAGDYFLCANVCYKRLVDGVDLQKSIQAVFEKITVQDTSFAINVQDGKSRSSEMSTLDIEILPVPEPESEEASPPAASGQSFIPLDPSLIISHMKFNHFQYFELIGRHCCGCDFMASSPEQLALHAQKIHKGQSTEQDRTAIVCTICRRTFDTNEQLQSHNVRRPIVREVFACKYCLHGFRTKESLMNHMTLCLERYGDESRDKTETATDYDDDELEMLDEDEAHIVVSTIHPLDAKFVTRQEQFDDYYIQYTDAKRCCGCWLFFQNEQKLMDHAAKAHNAIPRADSGPQPSSNSRWSCTVCRRLFESQTSLKRHIWANVSIRKMYHCKLCDTPFIRFWPLAQHFYYCKNSKPSATDGKTEDNKTEAIPKRLSSVPCDKTRTECCFVRCSASFDTHEQLLDHVKEQHAVRRQIHAKERTYHDFVCEVCQLGFSKEKNLLSHQNRCALKKRNICTACGKGFKHPSGLEEHVLIEHSDAPPRFECDQCGKLFKKKSLIKLHMVTHQRNRAFACEQCDRQFRFRYQLKQHKRTVHATEFPYECAYCDRKLPDKGRYDVHMRSHTGEKPYGCRFDCNRSFTNSTDRRRHEMVAHTGERPHQCPTCKVSYARHRTLQQHFQKNPKHELVPADQGEGEENQE